MNTYFSQNHMITLCQCCFQKGRSTTDQLVNLENDVQQAFKTNKMIAIFFELEKAYDKVWHHYIIGQLIKTGLQGEIIHFIKNFLQNRLIHVRINNTLSEAVSIANGKPQGSVLSVLCFVVAINNVVNRIPAPMKCRLYADNLNISLQTSNIPAAIHYLQICLVNLKIWCSETGFYFSLTKTKFIVFYKKLKNTNTTPHHQQSSTYL